MGAARNLYEGTLHVDGDSAEDAAARLARGRAMLERKAAAAAAKPPAKKTAPRGVKSAPESAARKLPPTGDKAKATPAKAAVGNAAKPAKPDKGSRKPAAHGGGEATAAREYTVVVAVREASHGREFLMVRHRTRGWELPGGKVEANEGPVHCALREFREETGHLLAAPHFVTKIQKDNGLCFVFTGMLGTPAQGSKEPSTEAIQESRWFARLPRKEGLGFPDDPYEEMGKLLDIDFG